MNTEKFSGKNFLVWFFKDFTRKIYFSKNSFKARSARNFFYSIKSNSVIQ